MYVLLGINEAESKENLIRWMDEIVLANTSIDPRTRDTSNNIIPGRYIGLKQSECAVIQQAISSTSEWGSECVLNRISCGNFLLHQASGRGSSIEVCIVLGPFQKTH